MMSLIQSIARVSPTASALAMSDPIRAAMMPIRDGEPDGDVLAAGVHQPAQRPDDEPDDDGADDESEQVVSLKVGSDPGVVWLAVQHDAGHGAVTPSKSWICDATSRPSWSRLGACRLAMRS